MREAVVKVFSFDELYPKVQEKVVDKFRNTDGWCWDEIDTQGLTDYFSDLLQEKGFPTEDISWSLSHSQGDGVAFYGNIDVEEWLKTSRAKKSFSEKSIKRLNYFAGEDYLTATISRNAYGQHYSHEGTMELELELSSALDDFRGLDLLDKDLKQLEHTLKKHIGCLSRILEAKGYQEVDSKYETASIVESIKSNEYEFLADGRVWTE